MLRGVLVVSVGAALLVAACGDDDDEAGSGGRDTDDEVSTADDQEVADEAIATFEGVLREEGFTVATDEDDEDDDDLEFESDECREFEDALPGDEELPGETASAESDDFERDELAAAADGMLESVSGTVELVEDPDDVDPIIELLNSDRASRCLEEAFRIGLESAAAEQDQSVEIDVEVEHLDSQEGLGDTGVGFEASGQFEMTGIAFPFSLAFEVVRVDRALVSVVVTGLGSDEPNVDRAALLQVMVDAVGEASA
jgi:hypothetical protein